MKKRKFIAGLFAAILAVATASSAQIGLQPAPHTIAVRAGNVIDPATGAIAKNQVIIVENGRIKSVGASTAIPADAQMIDLSQEWVIPGLMDAHTHITFEMPVGVPFESSYLEESSAHRALRGLKNAQDMLWAGFTAVRDVGNDANYASIDVRRVIVAGWFDGPTIQTSGKIISPFGGQSKHFPPETGPFWRWEYVDADGEQAIRHAVRQNIYYGTDLIKLVADNGPYHYSVEEIRAAVDEAHHANRPVAVHVVGGEAARNVIEGGADSVEHAFDFDDDLLSLTKAKGIFMVGTDFPLEHLKRMAGAKADPAVSEKEHDKIVHRLRRAHELGVKVTCGSDCVDELPNHTRADMMLDYLAEYTAAGIPPAAILKYWITNPATLMRLDKERGSIAAGFAADIIATPASPLDDPQNLRKVNLVMKDGKIIRKP